jgi:hypothetical protein
MRRASSRVKQNDGAPSYITRKISWHIGEAIEAGVKDRAPIDAALGDAVRHASQDAALSSWHNLFVRYDGGPMTAR